MPERPAPATPRPAARREGGSRGRLLAICWASCLWGAGWGEAEGAAGTRWPAPTRLRVEGLEQRPPGLVVLSETRPRFAFSHGLSSAPRGLSQKAYRITVRDSETKATVWASGAVLSANSSEIEYAGEPLRAFGAYTWSAAWQASDGNWSAEASAAFELGPAEGDWTPVAWLVGSQLRAEFSLPADAVRARAHVAAVGCHHLEVNGRRPSPDLRGVCAWTVIRANSARPRNIPEDLSWLRCSDDLRNTRVGRLRRSGSTTKPTTSRRSCAKAQTRSEFSPTRSTAAGECPLRSRARSCGSRWQATRLWCCTQPATPAAAVRPVLQAGCSETRGSK